MSSLYDFTHHKMDEMPGDVPEPPLNRKKKRAEKNRARTGSQEATAAPKQPQNAVQEDCMPHGTKAQNRQQNAAQSGCVPGNAKADAARLSGQLKGDLYYGQQQAKATLEGWTESDETVEHKLISKEMFPQG